MERERERHEVRGRWNELCVCVRERERDSLYSGMEIESERGREEGSVSSNPSSYKPQTTFTQY